jgi:hypothetical protein
MVFVPIKTSYSICFFSDTYLCGASHSIRRLLRGGQGGRWFLPRGEVRAMAARYGVKI